MDEIDDLLVAYVFAAAVLIAVCFLSGCYQTHHEEAADVLQHILVVDPEIATADPWLGWDLPYRINIDETMGEDVVVAALEAVYIINETAGAELLRVTDLESSVVRVHFGPTNVTTAAYTNCPENPVTCDIVTNKAGFGSYQANGIEVTMFLHEYMHQLGYYSSSGDLHDTGIMGQPAGGTEFSSRQIRYLQYVGTVKNRLDSL